MSVYLGAKDVNGKIRNVSDADGYPMKLTGSNVADQANLLVPGMGYNGATYDRWRSNIEGTLLASAPRTSPTDSANQTNYNARGVQIILDVTAASGTGGLIATIRGRDPVTNKLYRLHSDPTAVTATGTYVYEIYPGASGSGHEVKNRYSGALPRRWYVNVHHADGSSYTYSVGYALIL